MNALKLTDKQTATLTFTHIRTGTTAKLRIALNTLNGNWMQIHSLDGGETCYAGTKSDALRLANNIIAESAKRGLACTVEVK